MTFATKIKTLQELAQLPLRKIATALYIIDTASYCRIGNRTQFAFRKQKEQIADIFRIGQQEMWAIWLAAQMTKLLKNESLLPDDIFRMEYEQLTSELQ